MCNRRHVQLDPQAGRVGNVGIALLDLDGRADQIILAEEVADQVAGQGATRGRRSVNTAHIPYAQIHACAAPGLVTGGVGYRGPIDKLANCPQQVVVLRRIYLQRGQQLG